ncbi:hypothetical protein ACQPZ8_13235 [Actinomadura nitritigenes]|uniref:hypothetical protein n=1 Tax=Actinomadura nitritigenes TaxID=134602 RepID=UPI003D8ED3B1
MRGAARHGVRRGTARHGARRGAAIPDGDESWCEPLDGDATGAWTKVRAATPGSVLHVPPTRRGVLVVGDGAVNVKRYVAAVHGGVGGTGACLDARYGAHHGRLL